MYPLNSEISESNLMNCLAKNINVITNFKHKTNDFSYKPVHSI